MIHGLLEYSFVRDDVSPEDAEALLNGFPPGHPLHVPDLYEQHPQRLPFSAGATMAHLMAEAGLFKSVGDAKRNGWDKPVPPGYSQYRVGKRKVWIVVVSEMPPLSP
jgi:hypothetical protein